MEIEFSLCYLPTSGFVQWIHLTRVQYNWEENVDDLSFLNNSSEALSKWGILLTTTTMTTIPILRSAGMQGEVQGEGYGMILLMVEEEMNMKKHSKAASKVAQDARRTQISALLFLSRLINTWETTAGFSMPNTFI